MKYILLVLLTLFCLNASAQFPITQNQGSPTTLTKNRGGLAADSGYIIPNFTDTIAANRGFLKNIPGLLIRAADTLYYRNQPANNWIKAGPSSGGGGGGSCDTCIYTVDFLPGVVLDSLYYVDNTGDTTIWYYNVVKDGLISGGIVTYTGLAPRQYFVTAALYRKNGVFYTTNDTTITLSAPDPDSSRTDVFVVNTSGQATTVTGVESANPLTPQIDPDTDVFLTTVTLTPAAPSGVDTVLIYDENVEWNKSATGVTVNFANTVNPWRGSIAADIGAINNGDIIGFGHPTGTVYNRNNYAGISMFIRLKNVVPNNNNIFLSFFNGNSAASNEIALPINKSNISGYQGVSLNMNSFTWFNQFFDSVRLRYSGGGIANGLYLDLVFLENGISVNPGPTNFVQNIQRVGNNVQQQVNGVWTTQFNIGDKADTSTYVFAGYGLVGGGSLAANRTFRVDSTTIATKTWTTDRIAELQFINQLTGDVTAGPGGGSQVATLSNTTVSPGSYTNANITVDAKGRLTAASNGTDNTGITQLTGDATAGPGSGSQTLTLANTGVSPGSYTNANITVDAKGRVTAAANGSGGSGVTTMGAFGSTPNADGATISGTTLTLQPADISNPGGVSTGTQAFQGIKTFDRYVISDTLESTYINNTVAFARLENVTGTSGVTIGNKTLDIADIGFQPLTSAAGNLRMEGRSGSKYNSTANTQPEFQIGIATRTGSPVFPLYAGNGEIGFRINTRKTNGTNFFIDGTGATSGIILRDATPTIRGYFGTLANGANNMATGSSTNDLIIRSEANKVMLVIGGGVPGVTVASGGVGINQAAPAASAMLDITSTSKGFLRPVMTSTQRNAISSPAAGLSVYDTDSARNFTYNGSTWRGLAYTGEGGGSGVLSDSLAWRRVGGTTLDGLVNTVSHLSTYTGDVGKSNNILARDSANLIWGNNSMQSATGGFRNIALGRAALKLGTTGNTNIAIGDSAMSNAAVIGSGGIAIGQRALASWVGSVTNGLNPIAIGTNAAASFTGTVNNNSGQMIAIGNNAAAAAQNIGAASPVIAIGDGALRYFPNASTNFAQNLAIGHGALGNASMTATGFGNIGIGHSALQNLTSGQNNIYIGNGAGTGYITTGGANVVVGGMQNNGSNFTTATYNTVVGINSRSFGNNTGGTHVGGSAGTAFTAGNGYTNVGYESGRSTGDFITAIGYQSLVTSPAITASVQDEDSSVAIGYQAGTVLSATALNNRGAGIYIGLHAAANNGTSVTATGNELIAIGVRAAFSQTAGDYNIALGRVNLPSATGSNQLAIGGNAIRWLISDLGGASSTRRWVLGGGSADLTATEASAALSVPSTTGGFLPPKMTGAQAEAISSPAEGLMVYATDGSGTTITSKGWWGYDGTNWVKLN